MSRGQVWHDHQVEELRVLAEQGLAAWEIGERLHPPRTMYAVQVVCSRRGIHLSNKGGAPLARFIAAEREGLAGILRGVDQGALYRGRRYEDVRFA